MRKKFIILVIVFIVCSILIKSIDISQRYEINMFDFMKYSMHLNSAENHYLKTKKLYYGFDVKDAPFSYVSYETNQNMGILIDYFNQISVTLEEDIIGKPYDDYTLARKLKEGEIDTAPLNITKYNKDVFLFTQTLYTERSKILVRSDAPFDSIKDVDDISIGVIAGSTAHHAANGYFNKKENVKLVLGKNMDECFYMFGMKEVDAILGDEAQISYYLNQAIRDNRFRFLPEAISEEDVALAVNKDNVVLYDILNKGILELKKNQQFNHIHSKWFGSFIPEVESMPSYDNASDVVIFVLAIIFLLGFWNRAVSEQVSLKTKELNESRKELRDIVDALMDGIIVTDDNDCIETCNVTVLKLIGLSYTDVLGKKLYQIKELSEYLNHINEKEAFKYKNLYYLVSRRDFDISLGKKILIIEDYTERYRYEMLTKQESKMIAIGELSAGFAHEIRNPLGLIRSYIYILRKKSQGILEEKNAFSVIDHSIDRINALIENLLNFSRLSMEENSLVDYSTVISSILELEQKNLEKNGIEVKKIIKDANLDMVYLNKDILELVLINLINNSIDALKECQKDIKEIILNISTDDDKLMIDFSDNGLGIPDDKIANVFNPFYTTKETGTGLGLYIVNSEVNSIDGRISLESKYGEGTTFHIVLPIERGK